MPKIIPDIELKIIEVGKEILFEEGYDNLSMRRIAKQCDIAVGTIYNYFKEKDELVAKITLNDWQSTIDKIKELNNCDGISIEDGYINIYKQILSFRNKYYPCWGKSALTTKTRDASVMYHPAFAKEIANLVNGLIPDSLPETEKNSVSIMLAELIISSVIHEEINEDIIRTFINRLNFS